MWLLCEFHECLFNIYFRLLMGITLLFWVSCQIAGRRNGNEKDQFFLVNIDEIGIPF